jgi:CRP-like cAMP-binding protein
MPLTLPARGANRLLAGLPREDRQHVLAGCEEVELVLSEVLCRAGERMRFIYFPTDSFVSLIVPMDGRTRLEVGMVGNEGALGVPVMLGVETSSMQALVQGAGSAWRMTAARFAREVEGNLALRQQLNRYLYVLIGQLAQTVACTRFHLVEARLARWLLMTRDRAHADEFRVTHEFPGLHAGSTACRRHPGGQCATRLKVDSLPPG